MPLSINDIQEVSNLKRQLDQLASRLAKVRAAASLPEMVVLVSGLGLDDDILDLARTQVVQYLRARKVEVETQMTDLGVDISP